MSEVIYDKIYPENHDNLTKIMTNAFNKNT
jgi:hypothetical protein